MTAQEYLNSLPYFQWLSVSQIPDDIFKEVWLLLEANQFDKYKIGWSEMYDGLFMKTKLTKNHALLTTLKEIEDNLDKIDWIYISTKDTEYVITMRTNGNIIDNGNSKSNAIFIPGTCILNYFEWIYKHAINIKIKYLNEK